MKLSKDGKALMSLIATLRSEIAAKTATGGDVVAMEPIRDPDELSDVVQYMIQTCKKMHFIRYGKCYAITDGEIEIVFDNDEAPVSLPKH